MGFSRFRSELIIRILLLTGTIFVFVYLVNKTQLTFTTIAVLLFAVVQIMLLIRHVDKTNQLLNSFLQSIRYSDFTRTFQVESTDSSLNKLKTTLNEVIRDFQSVRAEKEESYHYLQTIIQHIGIALIAYQRDGSVELINNATKRLFQVRNLPNIQVLSSYSHELVQKLLTIKHGENALVKVRDKDDLLQLSIYGTEFKIHNRNIMLVSIKNIQHELDDKEMESWQKLIRVLTHEIMNSITPISSLSSTVNGLINDIIERAGANEQNVEITEELQEISSALSTIQKRTEGLIQFVNTYRNLTRIPTPNFTIFQVSRLLNNIYELHRAELEALNIECTLIVEPPTLELSADEMLIEQVLINLIKNSMHALEHRTNARIQLRAFLNRRGKITIQVVDNGPGILPEVLDKIFIPFFSTKPLGSGIGLSLSRQIMRLHGGSLNAFSEPEKETIITLTF
ncbi:sensor histidine kinase [Xiashengella succiniciproducens]|mgnify:FL=1|jgi:two-component system nitrogen regulation sensor histidine kinase NtrY|uniref:histidine kinase n=1 Tax=Xiashengella succiniciproducens TaxID=2949635 RepID=A0A9J6ZQA7_9BACT|nr:ATP-binding protein [Alkaliflexus sp. Ai-910]URW79448.1 ATP-binding protein [Alkaliflexus sp. Ai-910]HHT99787.1 ATP-binding protein [Bacteroidales bacterium]